VLVHLEHGALVLAEDLLELVVGDDFALVLGVMQVVLLDVVKNCFRGSFHHQKDLVGYYSGLA